MYSFDDNKPTFRKVTDIELFKATTYNKEWFGNLFGQDDEGYTGDDAADRGRVSISNGAKLSLNGILANTYSAMSKPGSQSSLDQFNEAANLGSYTFADDALSESFFFNVNKSSFYLISVEQNYITKIVNLTRDRSDDDNQYNINSVTTFDTKKGAVKSKTEFASTVKYRTLTVTETTQKYKNNKPIGKASTKSYTKEEIVD